MEISRAARIVVGVVAAAVLCASASAADAVAESAPSRPFPDGHALATDDDAVVISVAEATLGTFDRLSVPRTSCPEEAPLLAHAVYGPHEGWDIPRGVEVIGTGSERGLHADIVGFGGDVSTPGWIGDDISHVVNWSRSERFVEITMHCVKPWDTTVVQSYHVAAHHVRSDLALGCPSDAPYLVQARSTLPGYPGWQYVSVSGVRIQDEGFIIGDDANRGAILRAVARNADGYQTGIADMSIIARDVRKQITVTLFCTHRTAYAARW